MNRVVGVMGLTIVWCVLWGDLSAANIASGFVVSGVLVLAGVLPRCRRGFRPVPFVRLLAVIAADLVASTVRVGREALSGRRIDDGVMWIDLPREARGLEAFLVIAVTLTPGTAVIDVNPSEGRLAVHVLDRHRPPAHHILGLAGLAAAAFPEKITGEREGS